MDGCVTCDHLRGGGVQQGAGRSCVRRLSPAAVRSLFFRAHSIARTSDNAIEMHAPTGSALLTLESAALPNQTPSRDCRAAAHLRDVSKSGRELGVYWKIMQTPSEGSPGSRRPGKVKYGWGGNVRSSCSAAEQEGMFGVRKGRFGGAARTEPARRSCPEHLLSKHANLEIPVSL